MATQIKEMQDLTQKIIVSIVIAQHFGKKVFNIRNLTFA